MICTIKNKKFVVSSMKALRGKEFTVTSPHEYGEQLAAKLKVPQGSKPA